MQAAQAALFFTVAMLMVTAYFLLGSVPLLTLKHDNPVDARFIRSFYVTYYRFALVASVGATLSFAWAGRYGFALGAGMIVLITLALRRQLLPQMADLGVRIAAQGPVAIGQFRRIHTAAIAINATQLAAILGSLTVF